MSDLKHLHKGLKKLIKFHEGRCQSELLQMSSYSRCALGVFLNNKPKYAIHHAAKRTTQEMLFGVSVSDLTIETINSDFRTNSFENKVLSLFSTKYGRVISVGNWLVNAKFIKKQLKTHLQSIKK